MTITWALPPRMWQSSGGLTREQLDEFAASSQQKACAAIESGRFKDEIVPVEVKQKKSTVIVDTDEGPRPGTTAESISKLRPAFKKDGIVTAGNASGINDGAAAIVVMSEEKAKELGVKPMATWVSGALGGVDPSIMGVGPGAGHQKGSGQGRGSPLPIWILSRPTRRSRRSPWQWLMIWSSI